MAPRKSNNTSVAPWYDKLAEVAEAEAAKEIVNDTIPALSIKNGILRIGDTQMPGNRIAVVVACNIFENAYYDTAYDPDALVAPVCYAFGNTPAEMAPTDLVKEKQSESCANCPNNEFGSAATGKGKACGNRRKLVCIPAGEFDKKTNEWAIEVDAEEYKNATPAILSIPPTSLVEYAKYIKALYKEHKRPVNAVVTEIKIVPDDKKQFVINFNFLDYVEEDVYNAVDERCEVFKEALIRPYSYTQDDDKKPVKKAVSKTSRRP